MSVAQTWLLPDGVMDVLPNTATQLEALKRRLLDMMVLHGYQPVITPLVEYIESLLVNANRDLDLLTFKITDRQSGRLMGVSADVTPQVARIDAHVCQTDHIARYCYATTVLHTEPQGLSASRTPIQLGAELFGCDDMAADIEIIDLLLEVLQVTGFTQGLYLDLGHVQIFKSLAQHAGLDDEQEKVLFDIYQRKSFPELEAFCNNIPFGHDFIALCKHGNDIDYLKTILSPATLASTELTQALNVLMAVKKHVNARWQQVSVGLDAAELRGYHYHTGLVFSVYIPNLATPLAKGGRYDGVGESFGQSRAATGFSCDLHLLLANAPQHAATTVVEQQVIAAPAGFDVSLQAAISNQRKAGHIVIQDLAKQSLQDLRITHRLVSHDNQWQVVSIT